jgi:hypothetical protein
MPWKINSVVGEQWNFIKALLQGHNSLSALCVAVYFTKLLIGHLHQSDPGGTRLVIYRHGQGKTHHRM